MDLLWFRIGRFSGVWAGGLQNPIWMTSVKAAVEILESEDSPKGDCPCAGAGKVRDETGERTGRPALLHVNIEGKGEI